MRLFLLVVKYASKIYFMVKQQNFFEFFLV
jgi:hypothetical protein